MRVYLLGSTDEVKRFTDAIVKTGSQTPDAVFLVDLRTPMIFSQTVATAVIQLMTKANRVRKKTAILLAPDHAVFGMQFSRLVREVGDPMRQTFTDAEEMLTWLADALNDAERKRAKTFVGSHKGLSAAS
jgi:hypothetical protein